MELERIKGTESVADGLLASDRNFTKLKIEMEKVGVIKHPSSWEEVQEIVRRGQAKQVFDIGDQFSVNYNGSPLIVDIIGIDHDIPTDTNFTHSLTIQFHDCIQNVQFDAIEPSNPDESRSKYGNNRYIHSNIRQWLNSNEEPFMWESQHEYDVASTGSPYDGAGFLKLLDPELVAVLGNVDKQVTRNTVTDDGGQDIFSDKVFLLSRTEVYSTDEGDITGESPYEYYSMMNSEKTNTEVDWRIKYLSESPRFWWLRSPYTGSSPGVRSATTTGLINHYYANNAWGAAPACTII